MGCPCGSGVEFQGCCEPFLKGEAFPETAEKLMRSRYTAYTKAQIDYIRKTLAPESQKDFDAKGAMQWAKQAKWKGLKINSTEKGGRDDQKGTVEFTASFEQDGEVIEHHEVSRFRRNERGHWVFVDGEAHTHREGEGHDHHARPQTVVREEPKVGRNDPCVCGSGKKFKKCCGADA